MCDNCLTEKKAPINVTIPAQQFLSCVKRTGEVFGAGHIIDVLRGSKAQNILKRNHQKLSTYGIGKDYSKKQWFHLSRQFIQKELILQDMEFGSLKLTSKAWEVLKENQDVFARVEEETKKQTQHEAADYIYDHDLFELLRQQRKKLADASNLPPYIIFPDKTLIEMATFFPQSREIMMELHGVGSVKFERYGQTFLNLICEYCQKPRIEEKSKNLSQ
jgi:ATP-dependent DNA helicase RecQ